MMKDKEYTTEELLKYLDDQRANYADILTSLQLLGMRTNRNDDIRKCVEEIKILQAIRKLLTRKVSREWLRKKLLSSRSTDFLSLNDIRRLLVIFDEIFTELKIEVSDE